MYLISELHWVKGKKGGLLPVDSNPIKIERYLTGSRMFDPKNEHRPWSIWLNHYTIPDVSRTRDGLRAIATISLHDDVSIMYQNFFRFCFNFVRREKKKCESERGAKGSIRSNRWFYRRVQSQMAPGQSNTLMSNQKPESFHANQIGKLKRI